METFWIAKDPGIFSGWQRRHWSDYADTQADLSLHWAHLSEGILSQFGSVRTVIKKNQLGNIRNQLVISRNHPIPMSNLSRICLPKAGASISYHPLVGMHDSLCMADCFAIKTPMLWYYKILQYRNCEFVLSKRRRRREKKKKPKNRSCSVIVQNPICDPAWFYDRKCNWYHKNNLLYHKIYPIFHYL